MIFLNLFERPKPPSKAKVSKDTSRGSGTFENVFDTTEMDAVPLFPLSTPMSLEIDSEVTLLASTIFCEKLAGGLVTCRLLHNAGFPLRQYCSVTCEAPSPVNAPLNP